MRSQGDVSGILIIILFVPTSLGSVCLNLPPPGGGGWHRGSRGRGGKGGGWLSIYIRTPKCQIVLYVPEEELGVCFITELLFFVFNNFAFCLLPLCWVFAALLGLSLVSGDPLYCGASLYCAQASHWAGFSCWGAPAVGRVAQGLSSHGPRLESTGSAVAAHGLSCSAACGIFLDQGSNPRPRHWQRVLIHCTHPWTVV